MTGLSRALLALGLAGLAAGGMSIAVISTSDHAELRAVTVVVGLLAGWGFIGAGLFAWHRRPENRIGALMTATGFAWAVAALSNSNDAVVFTVGLAVGNVFFAVFIHMLLAFPDGRLHGRAERVVTGFAYFVTTLGQVPALLFTDPADLDCANCPDNLLLVSRAEPAGEIVSAVVNLCGFAVVFAALALLWLRWRRASAPQRRVLVTAALPGAVSLLLVGGTTALQAAGGGGTVAEVAYALAILAFALLPYMFLGGLARARMLQGGAVGELVAGLGASREGNLRDALRRALRDDALDVLFWLPGSGRLVDGEGRSATLPEAGGQRAFTTVRQEGERVAAIVHDRSLSDQQPELLEAVSAAAALSLENERLDAELRARLEELEQSRARMVEAGLRERRRLERDLHDGAQQRLVSLALTLRMARAKLPDDPEAAEQLLTGAGGELDAALEELRELARGIHPAVLSDRGLDAALQTLVARAPLPVDLEERVEERLPAPVELAAYFVAAEALTNVAKYAHASRASITATRSNGQVTVEVRDDGVGGADPALGSGLQGLVDRVGALDGRLEVESPEGGGTAVRATIPCE